MSLLSLSCYELLILSAFARLYRLMVKARNFLLTGLLKGWFKTSERVINASGGDLGIQIGPTIDTSFGEK